MSVKGFRLSIMTTNAAFDDEPEAEVARILRRLADDVEAIGFVGIYGGPLRDVNGNTVGSWQLSPVGRKGPAR